MTCVLFFFLVVPVISGQLYTDAGNLVNASGGRVNLKCVNWYGAHQELFVVGGLEKRSAASIVQEIKSIGANCVRLPFSIDLWRINPVPPAFAVEGDPQCGHRAMDFFDCVVRRITDAGIMVILNNHNSFAGWVGGDFGGVVTRQGLWNSPNYSTHVWLDCLQHMAWRYRNNTLVVGMDIRNEIYDMDGTYITWGKSKDIDSDWMAASHAASDRIESVNSDMLIIVSGLCLGYDITEMTTFPGPTNALNRHKLMYTTHVYTWALWWEQLSWGWINLLSVLLFVVGGILVDIQSVFLNYDVDMVGIAISAFGPFAALNFSVFFIWYAVYHSIGCSAYTHTLDVTMAFYVVMGVLSFAFTIMIDLAHDLKAQRVWWFFVGVMCCGHALYFVALSIVSQTYFLMDNELSKWKTDRSPVPIWLGEFGSNWRDNRHVWRHLLDYIKSNNMHFAYWPLNGLNWDGAKWIDESFGLLGQNYTGVRNPELVKFLFD